MADVLLIGVLLVLVYWSSLVIYRTFLSPLRKVPGPLLGRFSLAWQLWHTVKGDFHIAVRDVHKKYGEPLVHVLLT